MKVYLSGNFGDKKEILKAGTQLKGKGHHIQSGWLYGEDGLKKQYAGDPEGFNRACAEKDLQDIRDSDALILFTGDYGSKSLGGKHTEFGYAMAIGKIVIIMGKRVNVFHFRNSLKHFEYWDVEQVSEYLDSKED